MKKIFFAFMFLLSLSALAQDSVIGHWKILVVYNNYMYYNVKLVSVYAKISWNDSIVEMTNDNKMVIS